MPYINVNNIQLFYQQEGQGEDLVLLSGFSVDHHAWDRIVEKLSQHYRVLRLDNRGAGLSDAPDENYSTAMLAEDVNQLLDTLEIKHAYVVGHSMGAQIATQLALLYPQKVKKLVLISARAAYSAAADLLLRSWQEMVGANVPTKIIIRNSMCALFAHDYLQHPQNIEAYIEFKLHQSNAQKPAGFRGQIAITSQNAMLMQATQIDIPTLLISGDEDALTPLVNSQKLAQKFSNSDLKIISGCGHVPQFEKPQECVTLIQNFC